MENSRSGVVDAVNDSGLTTIQSDIHFIFGSIEILEEV